MRKIELYTADNSGSDGYVATVEIGPFDDKHMPKVVLWGERFFAQYAVDVGKVGRPWRYRECFAVASFTPAGQFERWAPPAPPAVDMDARDVVGTAAAPGVADTTIREDGQQAGYVVLSAEERAKGFVRPVRRSYVHVGIPGPRYALRELTESERKSYGSEFVKFEQYPESESPLVGRGWTQAQLDSIGKGCETVTTMGQALSETYARSPSFYGGTFCAGCKTHFNVGETGEFVWAGTNERVGT